MVPLVCCRRVVFALCVRHHHLSLTKTERKEKKVVSSLKTDNFRKKIYYTALYMEYCIK